SFLRSWLAASRDLHSFPTRRSSDLQATMTEYESAQAWTTLSTTADAAAVFNSGKGPIRSASRPSTGANRMTAIDEMASAKPTLRDRKSTRLNSSHVKISYAVFCLKK